MCFRKCKYWHRNVLGDCAIIAFIVTTASLGVLGGLVPGHLRIAQSADGAIYIYIAIYNQICYIKWHSICM
jgi:hypothetical protein